MGYRLEVVRRLVVPELTRSERRSWRLHRQRSTHLTRTSLEQWRPTIERNLERLRKGVSGEPHGRNLDQWMSLIDRGDVPGLRRVLTGWTGTRSRCVRFADGRAALAGRAYGRAPDGQLMRRDQLEHAIRTACQIIERPEVIVVGSQAILGSFREDELPADATMSVEVDILPIANSNDETARLVDLIEGVAGEFSTFEELHGFS